MSADLRVLDSGFIKSKKYYVSEIELYSKLHYTTYVIICGDKYEFYIYSDRIEHWAGMRYSCTYCNNNFSRCYLALLKEEKLNTKKE